MVINPLSVNQIGPAQVGPWQATYRKFVLRYFADGKIERQELKADGFDIDGDTLLIRRDHRMVAAFAHNQWHSIEELP